MEDILSLWFFLSPRPLIKTGAKLRARSLDIAKKTEKTTLVSSGEDAKLHAFRVEKFQSHTRFWWSTQNKILKNGSDRLVSFSYYVETSEEDVKLHSKRVEKMAVVS